MATQKSGKSGGNSSSGSSVEHTLTLGRRGFLGAAAAVAGGVATLGVARPSFARQAARHGAGGPSGFGGGKARNVIFMVADGMSAGTFSLADYVIRRDRGSSSNWVKLNARKDVTRSMQNTSSLNALVTDSAAAASAWGSGKRVNNAALNVEPDGRQLMPILIRAKQAGKMTGCVTTTRITHATPAGFYCNCPNRDYEGLIARDLLERKIDVAMGGGERFFPEWNLADIKDQTVVRTREELKNAPMSGRLLGLFEKSHVPYVLDRAETVPGLVDMTRAALARLEKAPDGFVLQVEGGRVDHAAHANDAASLVAEQVEFDDAIGAVLEWMHGRDDTLLVVTTDHGNANPGLTSYRGDGAEGIARLTRAKHSFEWIDAQLKPLQSLDERAKALPGLVEQASGVVLSYEDVAMIAGTMEECPKRVSPFRSANNWSSVLGEILADYYGVAFMSPSHTADLVELSALGPGSSTIPSYVDNNALHGVMVASLSLPEAKLLEGMDAPMLMPTGVRGD